MADMPLDFRCNGLTAEIVEVPSSGPPIEGRHIKAIWFADHRIPRIGPDEPTLHAFSVTLTETAGPEDCEGVLDSGSAAAGVMLITGQRLLIALMHGTLADGTALSEHRWLVTEVRHGKGPRLDFRKRWGQLEPTFDLTNSHQHVRVTIWDPVDLTGRRGTYSTHAIRRALRELRNLTNSSENL